MKLLLDANVSLRLTLILGKLFPGISHVSQYGMMCATDTEVWDFAKAGNFVIVSKDADFHQRSFLYGHPPKVIWVRVGNGSTTEIAALLSNYASNIQRFCEDEAVSLFVLS